MQTPDTGLFDYDLTTRAVYFSPGYKRQLGYEDEEFANDLRELEFRLQPEDRERVMQSLHTYLVDPRPFYQSQYRGRHKDGEYRWMLVHAELIRDANGRPCRVLGCQLYVTERNHAEEDRARLAAIVQSSDDAIIGKTLSGIVTSWENEAGERVAQALVRQGVTILLNQSVSLDQIDSNLKGVWIGGSGDRQVDADLVLMAIGKIPNSRGIGLGVLGIDDSSFPKVDKQMRLPAPGLFAVGDVNGISLLDSTAFSQASVAINSILGQERGFINRVCLALKEDHKNHLSLL